MLLETVLFQMQAPEHRITLGMHGFATHVGMMGRDPAALPCVDLIDSRPRLQFGGKLEHSA